MGTRLVLVRHGHSAAQAAGVVGGPRSCRGLSPLGRRQVDGLADRLRAPGGAGTVDVVYASTMPRAIESAEILAAVLTPGRSPVVDDDLGEIREPSRDGRAQRRRQEIWEAVGFRRPAGPGDETYEQLYRRAAATLERIVAGHPGGTVVVVTHQGVIRGAMATFGGAPLGEGFLLAADNAGVTELVHDPDGNRPFVWKLVRYNDTGHLTASR